MGFFGFQAECGPSALLDAAGVAIKWMFVFQLHFWGVGKKNGV